MLFDSTYLLIMLVAVVLGAGTQYYVRSTYKAQSRRRLETGLTGAEVARRVLDGSGLHGVRIEMIRSQAELSDHFDPRENVLRLSQDVYGGTHVAAAGVAAHEAGHAVQHARSFLPARARQFIVPAANVASQAAFPLIFFGIFTRFTGLITLGALLYGLAVLFQVVTLPVEFDASRRALGALRELGLVGDDQITGARSVLSAAALTYIAATLISIMYLLYFLGLGRR